MQKEPQVIGDRGEQYDLKHRNPVARDFVIVSLVVLIGYPELSDGAKLTYWVIYSHDWYQAAGGPRKGYAYPTVGRLANLRHTSHRTIQRHLTELIETGLLTREIRRGKPSVLYIEEPGQGETERYLRLHQTGGDNIVGRGVTKMSPYKQDKDKQDKSINGDKNVSNKKEGAGIRQWQSVGALLERKTVQDAASTKTEWSARQILAATGDEHSLGCYRLIASHCAQEIIFEAIALLKDAQRSGSIRQSRGALFISIVRRLCQERGLPDPLKRPSGGSRTTERALARGHAPDGLATNPFRKTAAVPVAI